DLDAYYQKAYAAYENIFKRAGINPVIVQSDTGIMGGKVAHEFMLETEHGEDYLILSEDGTYSANQEIAAFDRESVPETPAALEKVPTPDKKTIEEVTGFLNTDAKHAMKAVLFETDLDSGRCLVLALVRGDLEASDV